MGVQQSVNGSPKMYFHRSLQFLILITTLVVGTQARSSDSTPLAYGNYYDQTVDSLVCFTNPISICYLRFNQLPSNKLLLIRKIQCSFNSSGPFGHPTLYVGTSFGNNPITRHLPLQIVELGNAVNGVYRYSVDMTTQWLVGQGRYPYIEINLATAQPAAPGGGCTLIGDILNPI
jgi:hypothetical protein